MLEVVKEDMQRLLATTMMLLMMTAALAGCAGSDITQDDVDTARAEGEAAGIASATPVSTLDTIHDRGTMKCGVKIDQWGMGWLNPDGSREGLDIEYCRAVAAAIGLNPDTDIEYVLATGDTRFPLLAAKDIDVLIRTTTWSTGRDASLGADFAGVNFFDGQGILIRGDMVPDDGDYSPQDLDGLNICVGSGTTTEGNLADWAEVHGISITSTNVATGTEGAQKLVAGDCSAFTGDMSAMVARKYVLENDILDAEGNVTSAKQCDEVADTSDSDCDGLWIAPEVLSKEPLAAAVRDMDSEWKDVVQWVWWGMVTAEELGVTSDNYMDHLDSTNPSIQKLLGVSTNDAGQVESPYGLGTDANPLSADWMQKVLAAVGNYGEAYDRAFCDGTYDGHSGSDAMTGCKLARANTPNALVSEGGLQYAPPLRT